MTTPPPPPPLFNFLVEVRSRLAANVLTLNDSKPEIAVFGLLHNYHVLNLEWFSAMALNLEASSIV